MEPAAGAAAVGRPLVAGRVGRPHGLDGAFHVTRPRAQLLAPGRTVGVAGAAREIESRAGTDERPILRLVGCGSREDAEALRGSELLVARADAPPLGEDEWYAEDLEGCAVRDGAREVGKVRRLLALPSCEALEVARVGADAQQGEGDLLVPLVRDAVRSVDIHARTIDIDLRFLGSE